MENGVMNGFTGWCRKLLIVLFEKTTWLFSDKLYLKIQFFLRMGYNLDLENPKTLSEKIQWLKLHDRNPEYTYLVDKNEVKAIVAQKIGAEHIIPTLGIWEEPEDVDFDALPKQFVLKTTHGGGNSGVIICKDKNQLEKRATIDKLRISLNQDIYKGFREWPYKNIHKRVIAEKYMEQEDGSHLIDYKFFCLNGKPQYVYVSQYSHDSDKDMSCFFDMEWQPAPFRREDGESVSKFPDKPKMFEEMKSLATKLSKDIALVRVDLYEINTRVYFSELTFYPSSGMQPFEPVEWDRKLGDMLVLPEKRS